MTEELRRAQRLKRLLACADRKKWPAMKVLKARQQCGSVRVDAVVKAPADCGPHLVRCLVLSQDCQKPAGLAALSHSCKAHHNNRHHIPQQSSQGSRQSAPTVD